MKKIAKNMTIKDILIIDDEIGEILKRNGLRCAYCANALFETLEYGAAKHNKDIDVIMKELTDFLNNT